MVSILKVDSLQSTAGVTRNSILQVVSTINFDYVSQGYSTNTRTDVTNMSVTITPTSSSSKVLILVNWNGEASSEDWNIVFGLKRGSTYIGMPTNTGSTGVGNIGIFNPVSGYQSDNSSTMSVVSGQYLDSPATTSATTYTLWFADQGSGTMKSGGVYGWNTTRTTSYERSPYGMIAMEIAG